MSEIEALGNELREARERRDLTLSQVERAIHIRAKFIEALETGQPALLPSPVQARGFLRNYARFLGFDGDVMVARWDAALSGGRRRRGRRGTQPLAAFTPASTNSTLTTGAITNPTARTTQQMRPVVPMAPDLPPRHRGLRPGLLIIGMVMVALFVGLLVLGIQWVQSRAETGAAALSPVPVSQTDVTSTAAFTPTPPRPTPLPNPNVPVQTLPPSGEVILQLTIVARTWLRVTVDGVVSYQGAPGPNTVLQYRGMAIEVRAANAAGVHAVVNDRDLGILGARGQIFDQTFTAESFAAQVTPTPPQVEEPLEPTAQATP
jgi:transcriptional regulator with XRE-family HTH domain